MTAVSQPYSVLVSDSHVMLHNTVTVHCTVPGHMAEFVSVLSWRLEERGRAPVSLSRQQRYGSPVLHLHVWVTVSLEESSHIVLESFVSYGVTSSSKDYNCSMSIYET